MSNSVPQKNIRKTVFARVTKYLVCRTARWNVSGMPRTASTICGTHELVSCSVGWRFRATEHMMNRAASIDSQEPVPEELLAKRCDDFDISCLSPFT